MTNEHLTPQQVIFQTIKSLVLKLNTLVRDLNTQHEDLKTRFDHRSRKINEYIVSNETWRKDITLELDDIRNKINEIQSGLDKINDHFKEQEIQKTVLRRTFDVAKKIPGALIAFITALIAIFSYIFTHFTFTP